MACLGVVTSPPYLVTTKLLVTTPVSRGCNLPVSDSYSGTRRRNGHMASVAGPGAATSSSNCATEVAGLAHTPNTRKAHSGHADIREAAMSWCGALRTKFCGLAHRPPISQIPSDSCRTGATGSHDAQRPRCACGAQGTRLGAATGGARAQRAGFASSCTRQHVGVRYVTPSACDSHPALMWATFQCTQRGYIS